MSFANPIALAFLLLLPVFTLVKLAGDRRVRRSLRRLVAPRLLPGALTGSSAAAGWTAHLLQLAAVALLVLGLARPQWGFSREESVAEGRDVLIAVDTSRSMLADDLLPDRLTRAVLAAQDLVRTLPDDRFGVLAFAGRAFLQAPLTVDHEAVAETLSQIDHETIPRGGSSLAGPLELAAELFAKAEGDESALVLFSDGDDLEGGALEAARAAREAGVMVVCVGVGTPGGSVVPLPGAPGQFVRDGTGKVVRTRLERSVLEEIARLTGGVYTDLGTGTGAGQRVVDALRLIEASTVAKKESRRPVERFQWFLGASFIAMLASVLAPVAFARTAAPPRRRQEPGTRRASAGALTPPATAQRILATTAAIAGTAGWSPAADRAVAAYRAGDYEEATGYYHEAALDAHSAGARARYHFGLGASAYKAGDLESAAEGFGNALLSPSASLQEDAHYNLGNTLFRTGEARLESLQQAAAAADPGFDQLAVLDAAITDWRNAIDHYGAALDLAPDNADAAFNRSVVEKRLEQLEEARQQEAERQEQQGQEGDQGNPQQGGGEPGDTQENSGQQEGDGRGGPGDGEPRDGGSDDEDEGEGGNGFDNPEPPGRGDGEDGEDGRGPEGELEAMGGGGSDGPKQPGPDRRINPETGFSRTQARQLLRAYADEDTQAKPPPRLPDDGDYQDW